MMILAGPIYRGHTLGDDHSFRKHRDSLGTGLVQPPLLFRGHGQLSAQGENHAKAHPEQMGTEIHRAPAGDCSAAIVLRGDEGAGTDAPPLLPEDSGLLDWG